MGLGGHDLLDERCERLDPGGGSAPAHHAAAVHVVGGEVGQRPAPAVLELLPPDPARGRWKVRVAAAQRLQLRLLIGADDVLVLTERLALPQPVVQVQDPAGLDGEVRIAGEDPRPVLPRLDRILSQPAPHGRGRDRLHDSAVDRFGGQLRAAPPGQRHPGLGRQRAGHRLDLDRGDCREDAGPAASRSVIQTSQSASGEPAAPLADGVDGDGHAVGDGGVALAVSGGQHDPGPQHITLLATSPACPGRQDLPLTTAQHDPNRAAHSHDPVVPVPWPGAVAPRRGFLHRRR